MSTKTVPLRKFALTCLYEDMEKLVHKIARSFQRAYGGDYDELVSEANLAVIKAYDSYNSTRSTLSVWVYKKIWYTLRENARTKKYRQARQREQGLPGNVLAPTRFSLHRLLANLGPEARAAVLACLDVGARGGRAAVEARLRESGMKVSLVLKGFQEVREAIT